MPSKGGIPWNKGKKNEYHLFPNGRVFSEEWKNKIKIANKGRKLTEEWKNKIRKNTPKGEKSVHYIKDRTLLKVSDKKHLDQQYRDWMLNVKKRDDWKCKISSSDCNGRLESHHILNWVEYPELRYDINNGITLCHAHHPRGRANEKRLSPYFMELVSVSKE